MPTRPYIPGPKRDKRPHRTALKLAMKARRENELKYVNLNPRELSLKAFKRRYMEPEDTLSEVKAQRDKDGDHYEDMRTWFGAVWSLRELEMDNRQKARASYVAHYRPIQTLDGLDPHWSRNGLQGFVKALKALGMLKP